MIPEFAMEIIRDYRSVCTNEWIVNDFMKDIQLLAIYGEESGQFSPDFLEWYAVERNEHRFIDELSRKVR